MKNLISKIVLIPALIVALGWCTYKAVHMYDRRADGFTFEKIHSRLSYNPEWAVVVKKEELDQANEILKQPFKYLGKGFQCYAFESIDGNYVLKFFRHQRLRLPDFVASFPDLPLVKDYKANKEIDFQKRIRYLFNGMKTGFANARHETAFLYVHLNKTEGLHNSVTIFDKIGRKYVVELDKVEFLLQRKARLIKPTLNELMAAGKVDEAKQRIDQIFELFVTCSKKGIHDSDGALIRKDNLGYLEDRCIYIDAGKLSIKRSIQTKEGFTRDLKRLRPLEKWLEDTHPALAARFVEKRDEVIRDF